LNELLHVEQADLDPQPRGVLLHGNASNLDEHAADNGEGVRVGDG
jgi:hypothetical protein